jgi:hypothetical protein
LSTVRSRSRPSDPNSGEGRVGGRLAGAPRPPRAAGIAGPRQGQAGQGSPRRPRRGLALRRLGRAGYLPTGDRPGRYLAGRRVPSQGARRARPGQAPGHRPGRSDPGQHLHLSVLRPRETSPCPGAVARTRPPLRARSPGRWPGPGRRRGAPDHGNTERVPDHRPMKERQRRCRCYLPTGERPGRGMG